MRWSAEEGYFFHSVCIGESGQEAFQVLLDQQGTTCLHAGEVPQRCQGGVVVQGPDPKWRCEGFDFKISKVQAGCRCSVRLLLDDKGFAKKVHWLPLP